MFWEKESDVHSELVSNAMRRDRFIDMKYLHFNDNLQLDDTNKYSKICPLFSHLNKTVLEQFYQMKQKALDADESMVPYYGKHGCKQFMKSKSIKFDFKHTSGLLHFLYPLPR